MQSKSCYSQKMSLEIQRQRSRRIWTSSNRHLQRSTRTSVTCSMSAADEPKQPKGIDGGDYSYNGAQYTRSCSARPLLQGYRDESLVLERLVSLNGQQQPPVSSTAVAHSNGDCKEISGDRTASDKTAFLSISSEANLTAPAEVYVKSEESSPGIHYSSPEIKSPSRPSFVTVPEEERELQQQSSVQRRRGAFSSACNSIFTLAAYANNRFDRNEAWDTPKDPRDLTRRSFLPLQTPSLSSKIHGKRPSTTHRMKRTIEEYKPTMAPVTANSALQQDIRDGFDEEETVLPSRQHSAKRRKRSPPLFGMGSLSITVGSKPIPPRKVTKRIGIRQAFLVDPDLDPDNNMTKGQPKKVRAEVGISTTSSFAEQPHQIIPSIETATTYDNNESQAILPPLRTHESVRQIGDQRHDSDGLDMSPSFLDSNTHTTAGFLCGSYSRLGTTDPNTFETSSFNASRFWTSSVSRASSQTNQLFDSRGNSRTNDDETQCRSEGGTSFSIVAATDQLAWRRNKSHFCKSLLSPEYDRNIHTYGESHTALSLTTESWQNLQGRFAAWTGTLEDLRPRPRPTGVLFQG
ncbi:hypothetical protein LX32DRAFT_414753 [Colletotrichum zoysiae]|uniref:Uncharacterized protein n=1 Tax=Colletotrichum zoysiae TaxID=1216348 RepID=A0AAD9M4B3_9PEZI|nr:hypothetical protein LX32DRAFT_414753 [Colletotrichum zoysiae]